MKRVTLSYLIVLILILSCTQSDFNGASRAQHAAINLGLKKNATNRIVLLGGTLISQMENHGYLEGALLRHLPEYKLTFRNIGWPADDVFGMARSQFGSAQNTRSWKPPSAEEGFGSKVLMQHIKDAKPTTLMIGYGPGVAYMQSEEEFELFKSGYRRLLDFVDSLRTHVILISPPRQEAQLVDKKVLNDRNQQLLRASNFIAEEAKARGVLAIDLYNRLVAEPGTPRYTENGAQLNAAGYQKMSEIILSSMDLKVDDQFLIELDSIGQIKHSENVHIGHWRRTVRGASFDVTSKALQYTGQIKLGAPFAVYVDGVLMRKGQDLLEVCLAQDSIQADRLRGMIYEKNQLHRYRLRPLNEAYIYLFRRHEMGHLAYEMEDYARLVNEKEFEINYLLKPNLHRVEVELIKSWQPPRDYPEHEVPAHIPTPNIEAEIEAFTLAPGLNINAFATDPMIANPIYITWDSRGRAWVATSTTYPHIVPGKEPNDQIVILEDIDQDGFADKSTVFADGLLVPHSVMPTEGGAYVASTTELIFLEDSDGDDHADKRTVIFDGFGNADVHHMIHGFVWAPWGDLFFTQSIYINSFVETAYGPRILNGSGIWQFRPETQRLEVFCRGLNNSWGHAFDEWGQAFATDGAGSTGISYIFPESAHVTAVGAAKILDGLNSGTPKNTAAEVIYSRHLPHSWHGSIVTNDFRANRTVRYQIAPKASGYESKEVETIAHSEHRSYRPVDNKVGPDGALYIVDWYNPIIDHGEVDFHHPIRDKAHGRIWRVTNKNRPLLSRHSFPEMSQEALLDLLKSPEQYTRRQANRALVENHCPPSLLQEWTSRLNRSDPNFQRNRLEGIWLGAAINYLDEDLLEQVLRSSDARARAAGIRMLAHWNLQNEYQGHLKELIRDAHPQVRLEAIHALREEGSKAALQEVLSVLERPMDDNLDFAAWFAARQTQDHWLTDLTSGDEWLDGDVNKRMFALLACDNREVVTRVKELISSPRLKDKLRREGWHLLARLGDPSALDLVLLEATRENNATLLKTMIGAPESNEAQPTDSQLLGDLLSHENIQMRIAALQLIDRWHIEAFTPQVISRIADSAKKPEERRAAGRSLWTLDERDVVRDLARKEGDIQVRVDAASVWAEKEPAAAASTAAGLLEKITEPSHAESLFRTYSRKEDGPQILAGALEGRSLEEAVASAGLSVVQRSGMDLSALVETIRKAGSIQQVGTDMTVSERKNLIAAALKSGNQYRGRHIYHRPQLLCGSCHQIDHIGGLIGPDLTTVGSYMTPNSLLESLLNPSKDIKQGYETVILTRTDGELLSGTLHRKTDRATLIRIANGEIIEVPAEEIEKIDVSPVSLMPAGLTASLHRDELKDLLYFLVTLGQEEL